VEASKAALEFAAKAEAAFRRFALATHQLHVVAVHLALVASQWGPTAFLCEYWIERLMQVRVQADSEGTRLHNSVCGPTFMPDMCCNLNKLIGNYAVKKKSKSVQSPSLRRSGVRVQPRPFYT
jgi:hypothetical protein